MHRFILENPEKTDTFGQTLAQSIRQIEELVIRDGLNIRLNGDLGAGKTATTRAMLRALGVDGRIKSPTFTLLETYPISGDMEVFHYDFYRFEDPEEFLDAGFRDDFAPGHITMVEWSEKAEPCLPAADLILTLTVEGAGRAVTLEPQSALGSTLTDRIVSQWTSLAAN